MNLFIRLAVFVLFTLGIYFIPWWFLFAAVFIFMVLKRVILIELILPAFMLDIMYGTPLGRFNNFQFVATVIFLAMLLVVFVIKKYIRN